MGRSEVAAISEVLTFEAPSGGGKVRGNSGVASLSRVPLSCLPIGVYDVLLKYPPPSDIFFFFVSETLVVI